LASTFSDGVTRTSARRQGHLHLEITASPLRNAVGHIIAGIEITRDITERVRSEQRLHIVREELQAIYDASPDMIFVHDDLGCLLDVNDNMLENYGFSRNEVRGLSLLELSGAGLTADMVKEKFAMAMQGLKQDFEWMARRKNGEEFPVEVRLRKLALPSPDNDKKIGVLAIVRDITERKTAEEEKKQLELQLLHAQKMESIGRFAGGLAHDFNNILSAILGYSELVLMDMPPDHPMAQPIGIIKKSAERAAELTRQLLTFSRKQALDPQAVELNFLVDGIVKMLSRIIHEDIVIKTDTTCLNRPVLADPGQLEQVIMNLAVNAADAMPHGGKLLLRTEDLYLHRGALQPGESINPGPYVQLTVTDTGIGMDAATMEKIFEPFFTTKAEGKGTGLGLASVYGIVQQHNGMIRVESAPGQGTTFKILLPTAMHPGCKLTEPREITAGGTETVLVVDDEPSIQRLVIDLLTPLGYSMLAASSGDEALTLAVATRSIDLLITDLIMPGMQGQELAEKFLAHHSKAAVLFMSGYRVEDIDEKNPCCLEHFLQKPLTPSTLGRKVREVLDNEAGNTGRQKQGNPGQTRT
jgi:PAS domain S-box-containing protein